MKAQKTTAVFFCDVSGGHTGTVDIAEIRLFIEKFDQVGKVWFANDVSLSDPENIAKKIRKNLLERIIIAGNNPGMYKSAFSRALFISGYNPENVDLIHFPENGSPDKQVIDGVKLNLFSLLHNIPLDDLVENEDNEINPATLVIGGGIAGIQASLEIAAGKNIVYLVEKSGTIGGHMAMFDKTFPTLDCAACILTPKMVDVGQNRFIKLLTYSEVQEVTGVPGNFQVKILKKARRINPQSCIGCGTCAEKCPTKTYSEFDAFTTHRKAAYIPFPQAVPNKFLIDETVCTYVLKGKCGICAKVCPVPGCINLDEKDEVIVLTVGNIIVATGFRVFDASKFEQFGYGKYPNVLTSLELERLINASGPTGGKISRRTKDKSGNWIFTQEEAYYPKNVAIIHCIGSRDENHNRYCSKVCCMYSLKLAHLLKEKLPDAEINEYYIDIRAYGKGYEEFYNRVKNEGVNIIRGRPAKVHQYGNELIVRCEDVENSRIVEQKVDLVILAVGTEPNPDSATIAKMLGIKTDSDGWFIENDPVSDPVGTNRPGIFIAGVCQGPKDIPDSVAQASAAASGVLRSIITNKIRTTGYNLSSQQIEAKVKIHCQILEEAL